MSDPGHPQDERSTPSPEPTSTDTLLQEKIAQEFYVMETVHLSTVDDDPDPDWRQEALQAWNTGLDAEDRAPYHRAAQRVLTLIYASRSRQEPRASPPETTTPIPLGLLTQVLLSVSHNLRRKGRRLDLDTPENTQLVQEVARALGRLEDTAQPLDPARELEGQKLLDFTRDQVDAEEQELAAARIRIPLLEDGLRNVLKILHAEADHPSPHLGNAILTLETLLRGSPPEPSRSTPESQLQHGLHAAWTRCVGTPEYQKETWQEAMRQLCEALRDPPPESRA